MIPWTHLWLEFPWMGTRSLRLVDQDAFDRVRDRLIEKGFEILVLEGARVGTEERFYDECRRLFRFPAHFDRTHDAFEECFADFCLEGPCRVALLWRDADTTLRENLATFLWAMTAFLNAHVPDEMQPEEVRSRLPRKVEQFEVLFFGHGKGFETQPPRMP